MQFKNNLNLKGNPFVNCSSDFVKVDASHEAIETQVFVRNKNTTEWIMISFWKLLWAEKEDFGQTGYVTDTQGNWRDLS